MNGNLPLIVEDAKRLGDAVFGIYPILAERYTTTIGPVVSADQQKILFDLAVACIGISNKEQRVQQMRDERKNGNGNGRPVPTPPQPPKDREPVTLDDSQKKPRDDRDRPTEQLIDDLNIKTPKQAGYLRYKGEISFKEWQRVRDEVSKREIVGGRMVTSP